MLGQIVYQAGARPRLERAQAGGLRVLRAELDPEGFWGERRLRRAARLLARAGAVRVLVPRGFDRWEALERQGLRRVDPLPFLRAHAAVLAVAALRKAGQDPARCAVALRGERAGRDLERAAHQLCALVREVCVSAPRGGEALSGTLRWEYGVAVRPDFAEVPAAVRFDPGTWAAGGAVLDLFPPSPCLGPVGVSLPGLEAGDGDPLCLLAALWEAGKVDGGALEFT
ncbi:MAG: hypothetical protein HFF39_05735 [Lawsonibacter sp.]|nr:hypothetical protein [Lawsonibacter sp.]